jgi:hypothetical protein
MPRQMGQNPTIWRIFHEKIPKIENFGPGVIKKENPGKRAITRLLALSTLSS